jgi:hypothetical protein
MAPPPRTQRTPRLRSPLARAVVPVLGGIVFLAALFGVVWLISAAVSGDGEGVRIGDTTFDVGRVDYTVQRIERDGPLLFPDLKGTRGERAIFLDHDPNAVDIEGWHLYFAYRADTGPSCLVEVDTRTRELKDCNGTVVTVADLEPAEPEARVVIEGGKQPRVTIQFAAAQVDTSVSGT